MLFLCCEFVLVALGLCCCAQSLSRSGGHSWLRAPHCWAHRLCWVRASHRWAHPLCWVRASHRWAHPLLGEGVSLLGSSSLLGDGFSLQWPFLLQFLGLVAVIREFGCSMACGIFPDQESNPCPLHWQADSYPLYHQGSSILWFCNSLYFLTHRDL